MSEHTPTPWHCDHLGIFATDGVLARIPNHPDNGINWEADAAFIVKAVNAHDVLVKALVKIEYALRKDSLTDNERVESARVVALAALASIKETA